MRSVVLIAVALLLASLAACSTNAPQPTTQHQTYTYNYMSSPSNDHWKPRQQISITWTPQTGPLTADTAPAKVVFTLKLIGPYASVSDLKAASSATASAAVSASPIATDTWSGKTFAQSLDLPASLTPGYYNLVEAMTQTTSAGGSYTASGASVLVIGE
ncbi:MAG TPA: hypothetical protein VKQ30_26255 [Ktedonobacterales bacterium]|nr:hypothetical protein [Ktedonobacterales bacterium]